jgi:uncharacterized membrane protein YsdA (DUF1294 family)/cold shock CspA family protein
MQQKGIIKTWKDDKGFGFIRPDDGGNEVFFHISGFVHRNARPTVNTAVYYTVTYDAQQRPRASEIHYAIEPTVNVPIGPVIIAFSIVGIFFLVLVLATALFHLSPIIFLIYAVVSMITVAAYYTDKSRALRGEWRISEGTLHLLEFAGGWPGALIAQAYYRHKTVKSSYQAAYWLAIVLNLILLIGYGVMVMKISNIHILN